MIIRCKCGGALAITSSVGCHAHVECPYCSRMSRVALNGPHNDINLPEFDIIPNIKKKYAKVKKGIISLLNKRMM